MNLLLLIKIIELNEDNDDISDSDIWKGNDKSQDKNRDILILLSFKEKSSFRALIPILSVFIPFE